MRIALVANPASGRGTDPARLIAALGGAEVFSPDAGDAVEAFAPDRIVVAGGDGTIGSVAALAGRLKVPLAVIPTGTANDFARANDLPLDVDAAARIARGSQALLPLELGRLSSGRPFVNATAAGLSSVAGRRAQPLKSRFGPLAYGMGAVRAAATSHPVPIRVRVDQQEVFAAAAWQIIVACTGAFGGGSGIGAADATDGDLDVVIVPAGSKLGLVRRAWGLRTKTIERQRHVEHFEGKVVEVDLPPGSELNCDGEFVDGGLDYVTATANAFKLVVPA